MKKQILIILSVFMVISFVSCKKDSISLPSNDPLMQDLAAWFKFDQNYKDNAGKVADGIPAGTPQFVADHNGNPSKALRFDGGSKLTIDGVNYKGLSTTLCAWVKYEIPNNYARYFLTPSANGLAFRQVDNKFAGVAIVPTTESATSQVLDNNWHHLAVTYDGTDVRLYVDGTLSSTTNNPGNVTDKMMSFIVGFWNNEYWTGSVDDFRVYSRLLSATDIQKLASL